MTDVGGRCPTCAPARKLPQMEIGPLYLVRALGAAVVAGGALGGVWGLLLPNSLGFFALLTGAALGYAVAESVSVATNRKFGVLLQITASAGIILAYGVRNVVSDVPIIPSGDLYGYISVGVGIVVAVNRLKG